MTAAKVGNANDGQRVCRARRGPLMAALSVVMLLSAVAASAAGTDEVAHRGPDPVWPAPMPIDPPPHMSRPTGNYDDSPDDVPVASPEDVVQNERNPETPTPARPEAPAAPGTDADRLGVPDPEGQCDPAECFADHMIAAEPANKPPEPEPQGAPTHVVATEDDPILMAATAGASLGLFALAVLVGRSAITASLLRMWAVFAVRRAGDELEGHPVRSMVLRHLELHPGATTRELAKASGVTYRRVVYHLAMLERSKRVRVRVVGRKRLHFAAHAPRVQDDELRMRALADPATSSGRMLAHMAHTPGPSLTRIARAFGLSVGNTHYHVQRLREAGLVHATRQGSRIRHYVTTRGREWVDRMLPLARAQAESEAVRTASALGAGVAA